jgi:hypothetical protein
MIKCLCLLILLTQISSWATSPGSEYETENWEFPEVYLLEPESEEIILHQDSNDQIDPKENKKSLSRIRKKSKNLIKDLVTRTREEVTDLDIDFKQDILSLSAFKLAASVNSKEIKVKDIIHDPYKHKLIIHKKSNTEQLAQWNKLRIKAIAGIRPDIEILAGISQSGFSFGPGITANAEYNVEYSFIVPSNKTVIQHNKNAFKRAKDKLGLTFGSFKHLSIPYDPAKLIEKYEAGSEIEIKRYHKLYAGIGPTLGFQNVSAYARLIFSLSGNIIRNIKIYEDAGKKYVRLIYTNNRYKSKTTEFGGRIGFTAFEVLGGNLKLDLNINFLSSRKVLSNNHEFVFDYTYDPSIPEAAEALKRALRGDLTKAQNLAVFRKDADKYKGVTVNLQKTEHIRKKLKKIAVGLYFDNSKLKASILDIRAREKFGSFIKYSKQKTQSESYTDVEKSYLEDQQILTHSLQCEQKYSLFFNLLGKSIRKCSVSNQIVQVNQVSEEENKVVKLKALKLSYNYDYSAKHSKKLFETMVTNLKYFIGVNDLQMQFGIQQILKNESCNKNLRIIQKGSIFLDAVKKIFLTDKKTFNTHLARFIGDHKPEYWIDYNSEINKNRRSQILKRAKNDKRLSQRLRDALSIYDYFNKNEIWNQFSLTKTNPELFIKKDKMHHKKIENDQTLAQWILINRIIDKKGTNPLLFELFHLMTLDNETFDVNQKSRDLNDSFTRITIDGGENCTYKWWFSGNTIFPYQKIDADDVI